MSKKFKKLVRQLAEKTNVSHQGAVNLLRRNSPRSLKPLDWVQTQDGTTGIISTVSNRIIVLTPATPISTSDGMVFRCSEEEPLQRFDLDEVKPYRLPQGERKARFVEELFDLVTETNIADHAGGTMSGDLFIFEKGNCSAYLVGEGGNTILAVVRPHRVMVPLWESQADVLFDGVVIGQNAVQIQKVLRSRMVALLAAGISEKTLDISNPTWFVDIAGDGQILSKPNELDKPYACGIKSAGLQIKSLGRYGLMALSRDFSIIQGPPIVVPPYVPPERTQHSNALELFGDILGIVLKEPGQFHVRSTDKPDERLLGFTVYPKEGSGKNELHLISLTTFKEDASIPPHLRKALMTQANRHQLAACLEMGINVMDAKKLNSVPLMYW